LELNGTQGLVIYADDNLLGEDINTIKKNADNLTLVRKQFSSKRREKFGRLASVSERCLVSVYVLVSSPECRTGYYFIDG
jgi:hypothetical protein